MSVYTTEVRYICETESGLKESKGLDDVEEIIENSQSKIFNDYPIFDENYRAVLNKKILMHYYTREICEETVGLWKLRLWTKMNEIMPYYNQLYESELIKFNPMYDIDIRRERNLIGGMNRSEEDGGSDGTKDKRDGVRTYGNEVSSNESGSKQNNTVGVSDGETHNTDWDLYNDTPQGGTNGIEGINQGTYLSNARKLTGDEKNKLMNTENGNESDSREGSRSENGSAFNERGESDRQWNRNGETNVNNFENYVAKVVGKASPESYSKRLIEFRKTFLNIDKEIIEELGDLFFMLY